MFRWIWLVLATLRFIWRLIVPGPINDADNLGWQTKLAGVYGVNSIPATYLLDGEGKIIAKNLRGEALEEAVAKALRAGLVR